MPYGAFHDLFWRLKNSVSGHVAVSCPDVMFNVVTRDVKDEEYVTFAKKFQIQKWVDPDGRVRWYGCRRGLSYTKDSCPVQKGIGVPPASLENLADAIKFVMKECEDGGMFCEFQEGTLLGKATIFFSLLGRKGSCCERWNGKGGVTKTGVTRPSCFSPLLSLIPKHSRRSGPGWRKENEGERGNRERKGAGVRGLKGQG